MLKILKSSASCDVLHEDRIPLVSPYLKEIEIQTEHGFLLRTSDEMLVLFKKLEQKLFQ
jgi:hypothetical protein